MENLTKKVEVRLVRDPLAFRKGWVTGFVMGAVTAVIAGIAVRVLFKVLCGPPHWAAPLG